MLIGLLDGSNSRGLVTAEEGAMVSLISTACGEAFGPNGMSFLGKIYKAALHIRYQSVFTGLNS